MNAAIFDMILLGIAIIIVIKVSIRGFIAEFFSMAAFLLAVTAAFRFYRVFAAWIHIAMFSPAVRRFIAFFAVFIAVFIMVKFIQMIAAAVFQNEILRSLDHALGIFLGIFEAYVVILLILVILQIQPFISIDDLFAGSVIVQVFSPLPVSGNHLLQVINRTI